MEQRETGAREMKPETGGVLSPHSFVAVACMLACLLADSGACQWPHFTGSFAFAVQHSTFSGSAVHQFNSSADQPFSRSLDSQASGRPLVFCLPITHSNAARSSTLQISFTIFFSTIFTHTVLYIFLSIIQILV